MDVVSIDASGEVVLPGADELEEVCPEGDVLDDAAPTDAEAVATSVESVVAVDAPSGVAHPAMIRAVTPRVAPRIRFMEFTIRGGVQQKPNGKGAVIESLKTRVTLVT